MSEHIVSPVVAARKTARNWVEEARRRRELSKHDPIAEALDYCAAEIQETMRPFDDPTRSLTPAQYGAEHGGVSAQAVTKWIRNGELEATRGPRGWQIARSAVRRRKAG